MTLFNAKKTIEEARSQKTPGQNGIDPIFHPLTEQSRPASKRSSRDNFATVARALVASQEQNRKLSAENSALKDRIKYELDPMSEFFSRHWASPDEAMAWERTEELRKTAEAAVMAGELAGFETIPYVPKDAEDDDTVEQ